MMRFILSLVALGLALPVHAQQQPITTFVVAACGTLPTAYVAGQFGRAIVVDVNGNLCGGGTFTGTVSGTTSNASSGVATSSTNVPTVAYNYGFNGTTWDQLQVDASKSLKITGGGTAGTAAAGVVTVQGIASMTPLLANPGTAANWGLGATAASVPANAALVGCRAASAAPTEVTDGQLVAALCGLSGKLVNIPYTVKELAVRGNASSTDGNAHTVLAAGAGSNKTYVTGVQCSNSSNTAVTVTFNDVVGTGTASTLYLPATGGNNATFNIPLVTAAATAFQFTSSSGVTTVTCNAQGYYAL